MDRNSPGHDLLFATVLQFVRLLCVLIPTTLVAALATVPAVDAAAAARKGHSHAIRSYANHPTHKKAIWGPLEFNGKSEFPLYRHLGVGIYQLTLFWDGTAPTRPANPTDPNDPAYHWPPQIVTAVQEGRKYGIKVLVMALHTPAWANGGKDPTWAPTNPHDYADFMTAASKRYPGVKYWMIWGEPCKGTQFHPLVGERKGHYGKPMPRADQIGQRTYALLLDDAYGALKSVQRSDKVIGGNCFTGTTPTTGWTDISPLNWMRYMRLPNGKPPRMDMYGHNPVTARRPDLKRRQLYRGTADFSDLDLFEKWVTRYIDRPRHKRTPTPIFLSEWWLPTDHFGAEAPFYVTRKTAADWTRDALRIVRHDKRIYSFGWFELLDEPPNAAGDEATYGLLDYRGKPKPAYYTFMRG